MDLNKQRQNEEALLAATRKGDYLECRRLVVDLQTDVNAKGDGHGIGWSPLLIASRQGLIHHVELFLSEGAYVNQSSNSGQTPLHAASWNGHGDIVKVLLQHGADPDARNKFGQTPLHWACHYGHTLIAQRLLKHGADLTIRNIDGNIALDKAISMRRSGCIRLLQKYQESDPDDLIIDSGESHRSSSGTDTQSSQSRSIQESSNSKDSRDGSGSRESPSENSPSEESRPSHESAERIVENSVSEIAWDEVDLSLVEICLDRPLDELRCEGACSVTEYEEDGTTGAWSRAPWLRKVDWGRMIVLGLIFFLCALLAFTAAGIARVRRGSGNTSDAGIWPSWSPTPNPSLNPAIFGVSSMPTLMPTIYQVKPPPPTLAESGSQSKPPRLPWGNRTPRTPTSPPTVSLQSIGDPEDESVTMPTLSPVARPTARPSAPPTLAPTLSPTNTPTKRPAGAQAPVAGPNVLWGRG